MVEDRGERGLIKDRSQLKPLETTRDCCCRACSSGTYKNVKAELYFHHTTCEKMNDGPQSTLWLSASVGPRCTNLVLSECKLRGAISIWASSIKHLSSCLLCCTSMSWIISAHNSAMVLSESTRMTDSLVSLSLAFATVAFVQTSSGVHHYGLSESSKFSASGWKDALLFTSKAMFHP